MHYIRQWAYLPYLWSCLLLTYFALLPLSQAIGQDEMRIGISSRTPPYVIDLDRGAGIDPELLTVLIAQMGYKANFLSVPFRRHAMIMNAEKLDAISLWSPPEGLTCHLTKPYRYWRNALFVASRSNQTVPARASALPVDRVGIFRGSGRLSNELSTLGLPHSELQQIQSISGAVRMLQYGRLDAYIGDYPTVLYTLQHEREEEEFDLRALHFFEPGPQQLCFLNPAYAEAFDSALVKLTANGGSALAAITKRHGFDERITPPLDQ